jgi:microcystin-dependent protein
MSTIYNPGELPAGSLILFGGSATPAGFLECNGSAVSRTTYAELFAAIATTWGAGDGSTTFNLPDLRGRAPIGAGQGSGLTNRTLGGSGGNETHMLTTSEMPAHDHDLVEVTNTTATGAASRIRSGSSGFNTTTGSRGGGQAHNNMMPFAVVRFLIKS